MIKKKIILFLTLSIIFINFKITFSQSFDEKLDWSLKQYSKNFIQSFFPENKEISRMGVFGFFYLWGLISFIESNIPEGLGGKKYEILVRDLKKDIELIKKDMMFLVKEVWGVRKLDRNIIKVQLLDLYSKFSLIIDNVQKVRINLIKPAYYLFYNTLDHSKVIEGDFNFSVTLNYLSVDSIWSKWRSKEDLLKELDWALKLNVNTVKITIILDYWVYKNTARINEIREILQLIKSKNLKLYITFLGVRDWYGEDYSFKARSGRIFGKVNFITWQYKCSQAMLEIINEFKPEYVCILKEPLIDLQEQLSHKASIDDWLTCFSQIASDIYQISPKTIVVLENGVITPEDLELFSKFQKLKEKNIAYGLLIYSLKDIFSYNQYVKSCKVRKKVIVAEFWDSVAIYVDKYAEDFIYIVYRWALTHKINLINLSYIIHTHTYDFKPTPAFYTYKNIISLAFMEGICIKGIKSEPMGSYGILYTEYENAYYLKNKFFHTLLLKGYNKLYDSFTNN